MQGENNMDKPILDKLKANPTKQVVYESTDYDIFDFLNYNRDVTEARVKKIAASVSKVGQKDPAIVNSLGKIISGQGRYMAAKLLGTPFKYIIEDNLEDQETLITMLEIHKVQSTFTLNECLLTYVQLHYPDYQWFKAIKEKHTMAVANLLMVLAEGWDKNHTLEQAFREGNLDVSSEERKRVETFLEWNKEIDETRPFQTADRTGAFNQKFLKCILTALKWEDFDSDRFLDQVRRHRLRLEATTALMWDEIEFTYNKGLKKTQKVRFPEMNSLSKTLSTTFEDAIAKLSS